MYTSTRTDHNSKRSTRLKLEQRRRQVASLTAQSRTEKEIAQMLGVDQSTISRDIQALREGSIHFVHDLEV